MSVWTYVGQIVNFLLFVLILYYLLYRPVGRIMKKRKDEMEADLREAEKKRTEAAEALAEARKRSEELEEKREKVLEEARQAAEAQRKETLKAAEGQARERLERFRRVMEQERDDLLDKVKGDLRDTIVQVVGSALAGGQGELGSRAIERLAALLDEMSDSDRESARKAVAESNCIKVRSAAGLSDDEQKRLKAVLAEKLGAGEVELAIEEDPSLVAGIEVALGHLNLAAHWRGVIDEALEKGKKA